jgi:hypothetical protein
MVSNLLRGLVVVTFAAALGVGAIMLIRWERQYAPHPAVAQATVERRIHLTVDTRWDTDHRRKFECREVAP